MSLDSSHEDSTPFKQICSYLQRTLRITISDGRVLMGTFAGTDQPLNLLLINAEEYRVGPNEDPDGRYVGQVLVPWKFVVKVEVQQDSLDSCLVLGERQDTFRIHTSVYLLPIAASDAVQRFPDQICWTR